jgi:predicted phosphate transport protein (TIGR00153 family)
MLKLNPTNTKFYDLFDQVSDVLVRAAEHFHKSLGDSARLAQLAEEVSVFEHESDEITHETMNLLHKSFITPLERTDIRRLAITMDDVLDALDDAARRMALYEIGEIIPEARNLAAVLVKSTKAVQLAVHEIRNLRKSPAIRQHCIEVHQHEDEGDRLYHNALGGLFKSGLDPLTVVKWKDIIEDLEHAIDSCQDVAVVIDGIVLENS